MNKKKIKTKSLSLNTNNTNNIKKRISFNCDEKEETESLSKEYSAYDIYSDNTSITEKEEKITTINDIYTENNSEIRKKIKYSTQKEKILKLCKMQGDMINEINELYSEQIKEINIKKLIELNNNIYNKILDYLDLGVENKGDNKNIYIKQKTNSFSIKSSYSNLNNLTKGKIIINNNYKIDIKNMIQNYIKEKNKNSLDYLVKNYYNDYLDKKQLTFSDNNIPKKQKKVKFKISQSSNHINNTPNEKANYSNISQFQLSHQIKKAITNKKQSFKNFKDIDIEEKISENIINNKKTYSSSKNYARGISLENTKSNSANAFTKLINSIFSKSKG